MSEFPQKHIVLSGKQLYKSGKNRKNAIKNKKSLYKKKSACRIKIVAEINSLKNRCSTEKTF